MSAITRAGLLRTTLGTGLGVGILLGLAEVGWAYFLVRLLPGRTYYVPHESFASFAAVAVTVDTLLALAGTLCVAAVLLLVTRIWPRAGRSPRLFLLARFAVIGGGFGLLYQYWFLSYIVNQP